METTRTFDATALTAANRRAIEDILGVQLKANQRLIISVIETSDQASDDLRQTPPTIEDWKSLYEGLTESQIEEIDRIAKTRANLTRELP